MEAVVAEAHGHTMKIASPQNCAGHAAGAERCAKTAAAVNVVAESRAKGVAAKASRMGKVGAD